MTFNFRRSLYLVVTPLVLFQAGATRRLPAQQADTAAARRIAAVTAIALTEYRAGVVNGKVIAASEVEEARLFVEDARIRAKDLSPVAGQRVLPWLDSLAAVVAARRPQEDFAAAVASLRAALIATVGPNLDPLPDAPPSLAAGRAVYLRDCQSCHGPTGHGDGAEGRTLTPLPANLADSAMGSQTPLDFLRKVTVGVAGTGMPAHDTLSADDLWSVAFYVSGFRFTEAERAAGRHQLSECGACRVALSDAGVTAALTDDSLRLVIAAWIHPDTVSRAMVAYARSAAAKEDLGGDRRLFATRVVERVNAGMGVASRLAAAGSHEEAGARATDAYLEFEKIETSVSARDTRLTRDVERAFAAWRSSLVKGDTTAIRERQVAVAAALQRALAPLLGGTTATVLFSQSFVIMLREGLEAMLLVAALMALVVKAGAPERKRDIGWGVVAALVASLGTAAMLAAAVQHSAAQREALEGLTMLVAAVVLFWVSYWLVSRIEVKKWQAFVGEQVRKALSGGGALALAAVAFLAVYREGFETVLFYAALYAAADGVRAGAAAIALGLGTGFAALCVVYYVIQRWGVRLPLKPFFAVTSVLLYVMAFSFTGQGMADLQEAGYLPATPLTWAPSIPFLGVFPTLQTLVMQAALLIAVLVALAWIFWLAPRRASAAA
jgi:high-affinity iron transporter